MLELLEEFADAWNRHDLEGLMSIMTPDSVLEASSGNFVDGTRSEGQDGVRNAFAYVIEQFPDARWGGAKHVVFGDREFSEWSFTGTLSEGFRVQMNGCDLFTFRDNKIAIKNSTRRNRPPVQP